MEEVIFDYETSVEKIENDWRLWFKYKPFFDANILDNPYNKRIQEILKEDFSNNSLDYISFSWILLHKLYDLMNNSLDANATKIKTYLKYDAEKKNLYFL